jgi:hypothetical protein
MLTIPGLQTLVTTSDGSSKTYMSTWEVLKSPGVAVVLYISAHIGFLALSYTAGE